MVLRDKAFVGPGSQGVSGVEVTDRYDPGEHRLLGATGSEILLPVDCAGEEIACLFRERLPL
ncbi:MAG: hypothetical protein E5Y60_14285, partial [Mesorhizobium sp.]